MIIQALYERYEQLVRNPKSKISPMYSSMGKISFVLVISATGELLNIVDMREVDGKRRKASAINIPEQGSRSSGIKPFFLSDKPEYLLGYHTISDVANASATDAKKVVDARRKYEACVELHHNILQNLEDSGAKAILAFFSHWNIETVREHPKLQNFIADLDKGLDCNMVFRLDEDADGYLHEREAIKTCWIRYMESEKASSELIGQCLITGKEGEPIAQTHEIKIKGVRGAQSSGAALVSFNVDSFLSYGKKQSFNAPVSKTAAFGYTTALNHMLESDTNTITGIGDMTVVFWAGASPFGEDMERIVVNAFTQNRTIALENKATDQIMDVIKRVQQGKKLTENMLSIKETPFYILGLSPNMARISVRMFWQGHFGQMLENINAHSTDMDIVGLKDYRAETPSIYRIMEETRRVSSEGKKVGEGPPPGLGGAVLRAIVQGNAYPHALYMSIVNRIRVDGIVNQLRVAIIKAYWSRYARLNNNLQLEGALSVSINEESQDVGYRLGRVFAVLEKVQIESVGDNKLNATIKDKYFASAATRPLAVFTFLFKNLTNHHMKKMRSNGNGGLAVTYDILYQTILKGIYPIPTTLNQQEQGLFILGYYHQKQQLFTSKKQLAEPISIQEKDHQQLSNSEEA
ncbi:type I-C CRISPR-associated protein Cas8c/Csd1 [Paenibacillus sp. Leaf72]|uniref:type I-C CRISPR-associated protein Cas8c/Csd1 n=1 Tax=Paenibacillus sp. Leaf72 TaxID=1736234 RepID=UPI0006FF18C8|nr:type I-C CRISPR-associated protein Cas8c/Csd1 [Paenibacillus sp. Leaf72]KQN97862.1 hypothetical protein ASF12_22020 [Paenibacillus sp. Leaf72]